MFHRPATLHFSVLVAIALGLSLCLPDGVAAQPAAVRLVRDEGTMKVLRAEVLIDAPIESVWADLTDYGNLKSVLPGYNRSTVIQTQGAAKIIDFGGKTGPLLPDFRYQVRAVAHKPSYTISIERVSGDFRSIQATYRLLPEANGSQTRLAYELGIDLGNRFKLPGAAHMLKSNTEKALLAMRDHCRKNYRLSLAAKK